jgi:CRP-like cAMP-binding protein
MALKELRATAKNRSDGVTETQHPFAEPERTVLRLIRELSCRWPESLSQRGCARGACLSSQGAAVANVTFVLAGSVKLLHVTKSGREVVLGIRFAPCIVGADSALLERTSDVTVIALTGLQVRQFKAGPLRRMVVASANLSFTMAQWLAFECASHMLTAAETLSGSTRQRLVDLLDRLRFGSSQAPSGPIFSELLRKHELAQVLGVTPEHLSRLMRVMESEGLLLRSGRGVMLASSTSNCDW